LGCAWHAAGASFQEWQYVQQVEVPTAGVVKIPLAMETFDHARGDLADLRIADADGRELASYVERPVALRRVVTSQRSLATFLERNRTRISIARTSTNPLVAIELESPAPVFLKPLTVSVFGGDRRPVPLVVNRPFFRHQSGIADLRIPLTNTAASQIEILIDDTRSGPIPITGATLYELESEAPAEETLALAIAERVDTADQTRLTLALPAARLTLSALGLEANDPLFTRRLQALVRHVEEGEVRERVLATGTVYRMAIEGLLTASETQLRLDAHVPSRELVLVIDNQDSPPLDIVRVQAKRWPASVVFQAAAPGTFRLYCGRERATAPRYDITAFATRLKSLKITSLPWSPILPNPEFAPSEPLPEIPALGAPLDAKPWGYRKRVEIERAGIQRLELDLDVLAATVPWLGDLRLLSGGKQVPYIVERTSLERPVVAAATPASDPKRPSWSLWELRLPTARAPVKRLICDVAAPLFRRDVTLLETLTDDRGQSHLRSLGSAVWTQTPGRTSRQFQLVLAAEPTSALLTLQTDNGDNAPVAISNVRFQYPVTRLLFKAPPGAQVDLYYGLRTAVAPRYDLDLVADALLRSPLHAARLGPQEQLKAAAGWQQRIVTGGGAGVLFWSVLILVVGGLLVIVHRLLPKPPADPAPAAQGGHETDSSKKS
jgi:hypothetical protein